MRKDQLFILGTFVIAFWVAMTYFLFLHRPTANILDNLNLKQKISRDESKTHVGNVRSLQNRISALEESLKEQRQINQNLLEQLAGLKSHEEQKKEPPQDRNAGAKPAEELGDQDFHEYQGNDKVPDFSNKEAESLLPKEEQLPVLMFACNRPTVSKAIDSLLAHRTNKAKFPIIVSQDCGELKTKNVILSYGDEVQLIEQPDVRDIVVPPKEKKFKGYFKIARHYGWALNKTFNEMGFSQVIIVEDDLEFAPDFFSYFESTLPILRKDKSLMCVSAWNDNGKISLIDENRPELLYRTDFFGGLGWMMTKELWSELMVKWPRSYWDDWIREPAQRRERSCIRPEISRTKTFGKVGVSNGLFFDKHLKYIKLNDHPVDFSKLNLEYLQKENYDDGFIKMLNNVPTVSIDSLKQGNVENANPVRVLYHNKLAFKKYAKTLGIMDDFKSGVPRMAYRGVVSTMYKGIRVYLAPGLNWSGYDPTWS